MTERSSAGFEILNRKRCPSAVSTRKFSSRSPASGVRDDDATPKPSSRICLAASAPKAAAVLVSATTDRIEARVGELRAAGFDAAGITGDLTGAGAASGLVSAALDRWGRLDIVVNNAGMISTADPVFESGAADSMDLATWQASLARNLTSAFLVTKAALPAMTGRGWGRIVMVSSVTGPV